jgi:hypothetical protein
MIFLTRFDGELTTTVSMTKGKKHFEAKVTFCVCLRKKMIWQQWQQNTFFNSLSSQEGYSHMVGAVTT